MDFFEILAHTRGMAKVAHILVAHEYEALDILRLLKQGKSFEDLAVRYSTCPSASRGGDLGDLKPGRADESFEEALFALKPGEVSAVPVRTRFGHHILWRKS